MRKSAPGHHRYDRETSTHQRGRYDEDTSKIEVYWRGGSTQRLLSPPQGVCNEPFRALEAHPEARSASTVVHEALRTSLFWPPLLRTYGGSHRWLRDRHPLRLRVLRKLRRERRGRGINPSPQVKWPNDIIGHSRLLQQNLPDSDIHDLGKMPGKSRDNALEWCLSEYASRSEHQCKMKRSPYPALLASLLIFVGGLK